MKKLATPCALLSATSVAAAAPLSFQEGVGGYAGTQDTMLRSHETGAGAGQVSSGDSRDLSFGTLAFISVDGERRPRPRAGHGMGRTVARRADFHGAATCRSRAVNKAAPK